MTSNQRRVGLRIPVAEWRYRCKQDEIHSMDASYVTHLTPYKPVIVQKCRERSYDVALSPLRYIHIGHSIPIFVSNVIAPTLILSKACKKNIDNLIYLRCRSTCVENQTTSCQKVDRIDIENDVRAAVKPFNNQTLPWARGTASNHTRNFK